MIPPFFGKQEVGMWQVQKCFPRYGVPIWSLWPNIRFLPSIVVEKNAKKNEDMCSMCIKINKVGKQEVGIWCGIPIWSLWPNIRFLPSIVAEKNATKNILDGRTEVKQYNYKKGVLDSQPHVIKFTSCFPMVGGSLRVFRLPPPLKLVATI